MPKLTKTQQKVLDKMEPGVEYHEWFSFFRRVMGSTIRALINKGYIVEETVGMSTTYRRIDNGN